MKTNEIVLTKAKAWLAQHNKSHQWLAEKLGVSKALVGHMLSGKRTLQPERIQTLSKVLNIPMNELTSDNSFQEESYKVQLRGTTSTRRTKREIDMLLFAIEDYIALKDTVK
jgi:transcriptional regulator with XRE-family HTH domain